MQGFPKIWSPAVASAAIAGAMLLAGEAWGEGMPAEEPAAGPAMMSLVDLVVTVCSLADPGAGQAENLMIELAGSLRPCMMQAEPYLAQWTGEHPDLQVVRFQCAWPESEAKAI